MSLINQMLQDLEKRRASSAERGALPNQVRVLPKVENRYPRWWWAVALAGLAGLAIAALNWQQYMQRPPAAVLLPPAATLQPPASAQQPPASSVQAAGALAPRAPTPPAEPAPAADRASSKLVLPPAASRLALDLGHAPTADTKPRTTGSKETPKLASSVDRKPRERSPLPAAGENAVPKASSALAQLPATLVKSAPATTAAPPAASATTAAVTVMQATPIVPAPALQSASVLPPPTPIAVPSAKPLMAATVASPAAVIKPSAPEGKAQTAAANPQIDKRAQQLTTQQLAENEYRNAVALLNQGRLGEAQEAFRQTLQQNPSHVGARQALFGTLLDGKRNGEAEQVLQEGLRLNAGQPGFAMALARLQVDRGDTAGALDTLQKTAPSAQGSPDFLAFQAALLQRQSRHQAAIDHYEAALRLAPQSGVWLMGLGISLQAVHRNPEAQDVFRRAKATNTLNPELQAFIDQRLKQLQ